MRTITIDGFKEKVENFVYDSLSDDFYALYYNSTEIEDGETCTKKEYEYTDGEIQANGETIRYKVRGTAYYIHTAGYSNGGDYWHEPYHHDAELEDIDIKTMNITAYDAVGNEVQVIDTAEEKKAA